MLSLSISRIIDGAMARSALRASLGQPACEVLSRDNNAALRRTVRDVLAHAFLCLADIVQATNLATVDPATDDIITLELKVRPALEQTLLPLLESLATSGLLAAAYGRDGIASGDDADSRRALDTLVAAASLAVEAMPPRLQRSA